MKKLKLDIIRFKELHGDLTPIRFQDYIKIFSPRLFSVFLFRVSSFFFQRNLKIISKFISLVNFIIFKVEISPLCSIGGGFFLPHPQGIVIGANYIGENCTIFQNVTIGAKTLDIQYNRDRRPILGSNVTVSSGAVVVGGITIGNGALIAANCVVINDVSSGDTIAGVPGKVIVRHT